MFWVLLSQLVQEVYLSAHISRSELVEDRVQSCCICSCSVIQAIFHKNSNGSQFVSKFRFILRKPKISITIKTGEDNDDNKNILQKSLQATVIPRAILRSICIYCSCCSRNKEAKTTLKPLSFFQTRKSLVTKPAV